MNTLRFGIAVAVAFTSQGAPQVASPDISGAWELTVTTSRGVETAKLTLVTGTIKGDPIVFSVEATVEGNTVRVSYSGTVDRDTMKGGVKFGELAGGTFKGTRKR